MDRSGPGHYPFIMRLSSTPSSLPLALLLAVLTRELAEPSKLGIAKRNQRQVHDGADVLLCEGIVEVT